MVNLKLDSDESIILSTQVIVISGVRHEAILTSRRFILVENETGAIQEDLRFSDIGLAVAHSNYLREPVLTLDIKSADGEMRPLELRFIRNRGIQNFLDRDRCISIFKERDVPVRVESHESNIAPLSLRDGVIPLELGNVTPSTTPQVPEFFLLESQKKVEHPENEEIKEQSPWVTIAAFIFLFALVFSVAYIAGGMQTPVHKIPVQPTVKVTVVPTAVTTSPTAIPTPEITMTTEPLPPSAPVYLVPPNGVWVRVQYPGSYQGDIRTSAGNIAVNNTGTRYYQLVLNHGSIDTFIEKQDGSPDTLDVAVFKDGTMVSSDNTTKPLGIVNFHTDV